MPELRGKIRRDGGGRLGCVHGVALCPQLNDPRLLMEVQVANRTTDAGMLVLHCDTWENKLELLWQQALASQFGGQQAESGVFAL